VQDLLDGYEVWVCDQTGSDAKTRLGDIAEMAEKALKAAEVPLPEGGLHTRLFGTSLDFVDKWMMEDPDTFKVRVHIEHGVWAGAEEAGNTLAFYGHVHNLRRRGFVVTVW